MKGFAHQQMANIPLILGGVLLVAFLASGCGTTSSVTRQGNTESGNPYMITGHASASRSGMVEGPCTKKCPDVATASRATGIDVKEAKGVQHCKLDEVWTTFSPDEPEIDSPNMVVLCYSGDKGDFTLTEEKAPTAPDFPSWVESFKHHPPGTVGYSDCKISLTTIRGHQGMILPPSHYHDDNGEVLDQPAVLVWWDNGQTYYIYLGNMNVTENDMMNIAESLYR